MLPATKTRLRGARRAQYSFKISPNRAVVVVFPLVPLTANTVTPLGAKANATSSSENTGTLRRRASFSTGLLGKMPGLLTINPQANTFSLWPPVSTSACGGSPKADTSGMRCSSLISTPNPCRASKAAACRPLRPRPNTQAFLPVNFSGLNMFFPNGFPRRLLI